MRYTSINSEVLVIIDGQTKKGKIVEAITNGAARIELSENNHAIASHSLSGENGTFHYPEEADAVKAAANPPSTKPPLFAAPAREGK